MDKQIYNNFKERLGKAIAEEAVVLVSYESMDATKEKIYISGMHSIIPGDFIEDEDGFEISSGNDMVVVYDMIDIWKDEDDNLEAYYCVTESQIVIVLLFPKENLIGKKYEKYVDKVEIKCYDTVCG